MVGAGHVCPVHLSILTQSHMCVPHRGSPEQLACWDLPAPRYVASHSEVQERSGWVWVSEDQGDPTDQAKGPAGQRRVFSVYLV